jgi:tripartite-type tricarboxylate transporter receptor subunit TctC
MKRITAILIALGFVAGLAAPAAAQEDWPKRGPVKMIIPFPPGGATDILGRVAADKLGTALGQQFVVENKGGAGGNIGAELAAHAAPDGYTIMMGTIGTLGINRALYKNLSYDHLKDFAPISLMAEVANVFAVHPDVPAKTVKELIAYAKANPGKLNYASPGNGTSGHLAMELFKTLTGTQMVHVTYRGSGAVLPDILAGQVQVVIDNLPPYLPHVKSGKLRGLAVMTDKPWPAVPDLPTAAEASGIPQLVATAWFGIVAPAKTPQPIIDRMAKALQEQMKAPDVKAKLSELGAEVIGSSPAEFASYIQRETEKWAKVVAASGATVD